MVEAGAPQPLVVGSAGHKKKRTKPIRGTTNRHCSLEERDRDNYDAADIRQRARALTVDGFMALDALHLASAAAGGASHFLTVDDKILNKRGRMREIVIVSPLEFVQSFERTIM